MTPAINLARQQKISHQVHEYTHDPASASYGLEAAEKLGVPAEQVFKTLVAEVDGQLVVGVVPVIGQLNLKALAKAAGGKKAAMADPAKVARTTGYVLGGVSPLGQKKRLPTFIDASAASLAQIYISAGRRGLEIQLSPQDLQKLTSARFVELAS